MADLIGRQASITFSGISTPANGHVVSFKETLLTDETTRFADVAERLTPTITQCRIRVRCFVDSATTPALTTGTGAVATVTLGPSRTYTVTNGLLIDVETYAQSNRGSPAQVVEYVIAGTAVTTGVDPVVVA